MTTTPAPAPAPSAPRTATGGARLIAALQSQGAVITVQGVGASLSPALGGWITQWIGYGPTFLLLGSFGIASLALWLAFGAHMKKY